ncbi:uncharacterized protein TNIN_124941 [Trichonephila inaurata madagascariensis]|uniref:Uncharacterized protein n=1 Tax=Trichonephila inaurata madagascariensis TaxID=2747483 RepID=A0A8X6ML17_9ARAC|nr:uncharacterized protein TNIN_124941 [Trichonephila inaurata madagascariensis]
MLTSGKLFLLVSASAALILTAAAETGAKPISHQTERQLATSPTLLPPTIGGGIGNLGNLLPAFLPIILILGIGAFILPAIGVLLFGGAGGFGGLFEGFSKKRSNGGDAHPLFSSEKIMELIQTVTKALEEAAKDK